MSKDKNRDIFAGLVVEVKETTKVLPVGTHVGTITEVKEVESKGTDEFEGTTNQLAVVVANDQGQITVFVNLAGYVRKNEITSEMIEDVPAPHGIPASKWSKMTFEDKVETLFSEYTTPEGEDHAVANYPMTLNINGKEVEVAERHRIQDEERSKKSLGRLLSMLSHVGVPIGTKLKGKADAIAKLKDKEIGVKVIEGSLKNSRGKTMLKVEYTMPASEVDELG